MNSSDTAKGPARPPSGGVWRKAAALSALGLASAGAGTAHATCVTKTEKGTSLLGFTVFKMNTTVCWSHANNARVTSPSCSTTWTEIDSLHDVQSGFLYDDRGYYSWKADQPYSGWFCKRKGHVINEVCAPIVGCLPAVHNYPWQHFHVHKDGTYTYNGNDDT